jgi:hypothetical protein
MFAGLLLYSSRLVSSPGTESKIEGGIGADESAVKITGPHVRYADADTLHLPQHYWFSFQQCLI